MFWEGFLFLSALYSASRSEKGGWHQRRKCGMVLRSHGKIARCCALAPGKPPSPAQTCFSPTVELPPPPHTLLRALYVGAVSSPPQAPSTQQDLFPLADLSTQLPPASGWGDGCALPPASPFWRLPPPAGTWGSGCGPFPAAGRVAAGHPR